MGTTHLHPMAVHLPIALISSVIAGLPAPAEASRILVLPLEAKEVSNERAAQTTRLLVNAIEQDPDAAIIDLESVRTELRLDLAVEAQRCEHDILCLVQLSELVQADRLVVGSVKDAEKGETFLRLSVVDVRRASLVDSVRWRVPAQSGAWEEAVGTAAKRLLSRPDATIVLDVWPKDADVTFFRSLSPPPPHGEEIEWWSGVYYGRVSKPGFEPTDIRLTVPPGGPTRLTIELEGDPLWFDKNPGRRRAPTARVRPPIRPTPIPRATSSAFANAYAWALVGSGLAVSAGGAVLMHSAQDEYNQIAAEPRYTGDRTTSWLGAQETRASARDDYGVAANVLVAGAAAAVVGIGWMVVDALFFDDDEDRPVTIRVKGGR